MNRREFIAGAGASALAGVWPSTRTLAAAQDASAAGQRRQDQERHAVVDACSDCMKTGEACLAMCNEMLRHGMTSLADCQTRVVDMLTMCQAMGSMAAVNTAPPERLRALATLCAETCRDCERACKPQATTHAECKACMDDAGACAKACDAYKAARR